jgi:hypothetical protein
MTRFVLGFLGALSLGSVGAFFLFVPPVLIATVLVATIALLTMGLLLMLWLGVRIEPQPLLPAAADRPAGNSDHARSS